jgi:hypothetical protein
MSYPVEWAVADYRGVLVLVPGGAATQSPAESHDVAWVLARVLARDPTRTAAITSCEVRAWASASHLGCVYPPSVLSQSRWQALRAASRLLMPPS